MRKGLASPQVVAAVHPDWVLKAKCARPRKQCHQGLSGYLTDNIMGLLRMVHICEFAQSAPKKKSRISLFVI
jgi:hypothetical protein